MHELIIKLTGTIQDSNFDEWKQALIRQIQSTAKELHSDEDFAIADRQAKQFKAAEKALAQAKQSAIEQAADIQRLFGAIDEVSAEARQARLSLERQIKQRKAEIKAEIIQSGMDAVCEVLSQQSADFQFLDHATYLDKRRFESAVYGKAGTRSMTAAMDALCNQIQREVEARAADVERSGSLIDSLPEAYRMLFQDRAALLALPPAELTLTIDKRIAKFQAAQAKAEADTAQRELTQARTIDVPPEPAPETADAQTAQAAVEQYQVSVSITATQAVAVDIARTIRLALENQPGVTHIRLMRG